ncbi:MAG: CBS domain-containing protein, partial [Candidatus Obscuribacterales bacterium]|nr:CBS domain-containing protein [Candidatus Obscuribacterales bacterium]
LEATRDLHLAGVPVMDGSKFVGLIGSKSLMAHAHLTIDEGLKVDDLIDISRTTVSPDSTLKSIALLFKELKVDTLAVVEGEELKGLIHRADLYEHLLKDNKIAEEEGLQI